MHTQRPTSLNDLPTEILFHICSFVDNNPVSFVPLLSVCWDFYFTFRTTVYAHIHAIISSDEYFSEECSVDDIRRRLKESNQRTSFHGQTLIMSSKSLAKLSNLLLTRPDLLSLVKSFNINALNFDATDRQVSNAVWHYMRHVEENNYDSISLDKKLHNFFLRKASIHDLRDAIFETSVSDFLLNPMPSLSIHKYTENRRHIESVMELELARHQRDKNELVLMTLNQGLVNMMLFCPHGLDGFKGDTGFVSCIDAAKKVLKRGAIGSMGIMNFQNMQSQSSFRHAVDDNDLVYTCFMSYQLSSTLEEQPNV